MVKNYINIFHKFVFCEKESGELELELTTQARFRIYTFMEKNNIICSPLITLYTAIIICDIKNNINFVLIVKFQCFSDIFMTLW